MSSLAAFGVIAFLVGLNGLFVGAEFALVSVPRAAVSNLASGGNRFARVLLGVLGDPRKQDRYLATTQLGIQIASLGLGMFGEHVIARWLILAFDRVSVPEWLAVHALASTLAVAFLTYVHIVLGEIVPKSLALRYSETAAMTIGRPIIALNPLLGPITGILNGTSDLVLRLFGIRAGKSGVVYHTMDELGYVIRQSSEGGLLRAESGAILGELLEFSELTAREVMVPRVRAVGIPISATAEELADRIRHSVHTRYPVFAGDLDHIVGVVHIKELLRLLIDRGSLTEEKLHEPPWVPETAPLDQVMAAMIHARTQMVVVMDEFGGTAGLVTLADLVEEVVGDIDESAGHMPTIHRDRGGRIRVSGLVRLDELAESISIDLEHPEVDTVSGLVLSVLGRPPLIGDRIDFGGIRFEVIRLAGRGVADCVISRVDSKAPRLEIANPPTRKRNG